MAFSIVLVLADHWFFGGKRQLGGYGGTMIFPFMVLSSVIATLVCRRLGVSQDDRNVEIIKHGSAAPQTDLPTEFEMRYSPSIWLGLALFIMHFSLLILVLVFVLPAVPGTKIYGFLLAAGFGVAGLGCWLAYLCKAGFIGRADEQGVKGYHVFNVRVKAVKWNEIESCEVTIIHDALGRLAHPFFVFKDKNGKVLLKMLTTGISAEQTNKFKAVIERHLSAV
jgi:hypothetical protein